jgi:tRNA A37 methylthiotransferase MiaB
MKSIRPSVEELPDGSSNSVAENPDLFVVVTCEASDGVRQKLARNIRQAPRRRIGTRLSVFGGLLDLYEAASFNSGVRPPQIEIVLALRADGSARPMVIEMVE